MEQPKNNFKIVSDKKARMLLPNALTLINVCIGLSSIKFALDEKFELSIIAIIFAAIFDALDGRVARMLKGTSLVGKELDSLADLISFGVAPAFIMYFWSLNNLGKFGWLLTMIFVVCVALRLASLRATQTTKIIVSNQPNLPKLFKDQKYIIKAGATPKLIKSANESNSFPTKEVPFNILATLPSNASKIAANIIAIIDSSNFSSKANLIELNPIQTFINVSALGKSILAFLSDTILKLFLGCSISYLLANSVSPAIVFCPTLTNVS